ncbi:hypothetical protein BN2476_1010003 [Paraburkholderia piptadeniae]|uniref:Uncharacterized protein n=1 Tax=Paraburkholderia piptadeniae TaxID=1701573 RepID=A0A1N7SUP6_9BURK|nr:hypothetical protein BN2476_1010003 [Paraburkholderia piptadeniae]
MPPQVSRWCHASGFQDQRVITMQVFLDSIANNRIGKLQLIQPGIPPGTGAIVQTILPACSITRSRG